jgi:predicted secreted protein
LVPWKPVISLGFLLLVAGCSAEPDVTATDSDNNHNIQLKSGDVFDIVLADDYATTGCQWHDLGHHDWAILRDLGQRYEPDRKAPGSAVGGTYTGRYEAIARGTVHVALVEQNNANTCVVSRRFDVDVTVH